MYFWLDLVSTLSMITDIGWIMDIITETSDFNANNAEQATNLARAGRGARIGTRAGRITRVIRLVRLVRIIQLYKKVKPKTKVEVDDEFEKLDRINKKTENKENALTIPDQQDPGEVVIPQQSKVGKIINERIQKYVIILVLSMLFSFPILNIYTWIDEPTAYDFGL